MSGLYIHVPFCHGKCWYCDFYSLPQGRADKLHYVQLLEKEWSLRKNEVVAANIETVYVGGGTPSVLPGVAIDNLKAWLPGGVKEFTVEMNPEDVSTHVLDSWQRAGMNRVSMGVQSLDAEELRGVGRRHTPQAALRSINTIKEAGITNFSLDLIIGLPGQTMESLRESAIKLLEFEPAHMSVYILSYEPGTALYKRRELGLVHETDDETVARMYGMVCRIMAEHGYEHYEISNFALPGKRSLHNSNYWNGTPYLGLGAGAHSFDGRIRRANPDDIRTWAACLEQGKAACLVEEESAEDIFNDTVMTRLRTADGLDLSLLESEERGGLQTRIDSLPDGRVKLKDGILRIPEDQWLLSDDTIARLFV